MAPQGEPPSPAAQEGGGAAEEPEAPARGFPEGFVWGAGAAGYPLRVDTEENLADSYFGWEQDVALLRRLGLKHYHFTVAWSHIQPSGRGPASPAGVDFYCGLVESLVRQGIEPVVTLYHWGLPLPLQLEIGGWESPEIVACFADYAREVFRALSIRGARKFVTLQEPWCTAILCGGHGTALSYRVGHHLLLAHAAAARVFRKELHLDAQGCEIGIAINADLALPAPGLERTPAEPGEEEFVVVPELSRRAAELVQASSTGWFAGPLFAGDYPEALRAFSGQSQLPVAIGPEERALLLGSADFLVVQHRSAELVQVSVPAHLTPPEGGWAAAAEAANAGTPLWRQASVKLFKDPSWPTSDAEEEVVMPWALRDTLLWIQERYQPKGGLFVLGPGISLREGSRARALDDTDRIQFMHDYLAEMHSAIEQGVNVRGYFAWTLVDSPALPGDKDIRSGLACIDPRSCIRTPKASARWLARVAAQNAISLKSGSLSSASSQQPPELTKGADPMWWVAENRKAGEAAEAEAKARGKLLGVELSALSNLDPESLLCTLEAVDAHTRACAESALADVGLGQGADTGFSKVEQATLDQMVSAVASEVSGSQSAQPPAAAAEAPPAAEQPGEAGARWSEALQHAAVWKAEQLGRLLGEGAGGERRALAALSPAVLAAASLLLQEGGEAEEGRRGEPEAAPEGAARGAEAPRGGAAAAAVGAGAAPGAALWWLGGGGAGEGAGRAAGEMSPAAEALLAALKAGAPQGGEQTAALSGLDPDTTQAVLEAVAAHLPQITPAAAADGGEPAAARAPEHGRPVDVTLQVVEQVQCAREGAEARARAKERGPPALLTYDDPKYTGPYSQVNAWGRFIRGGVARDPDLWRQAVLEAEVWKEKQLELLEETMRMSTGYAHEAAAADPTALAAVAAACCGPAAAGEPPREGAAARVRAPAAAAAALRWAAGPKAAAGPSAAAAAAAARRDREAWAVLLGG